MSVRFDARPFEYRRPNDKYYFDSDVETGGWESNPHSYDWLDPLYKYSEGRVTDAARTLGITNVSNPDKVNRILSEIQTGGAARLAAAAKENAARLQASSDAAAEANRKQLLQIQGERSAVSKMTQDYTAMLQKEADSKAAAQEKARVSAATSAANQARQGQTANLQIQPASSTPQTAGTQAFKRRKDQFKISQQPRYMGIGGDVQMPGFKAPMINL